MKGVVVIVSSGVIELSSMNARHGFATLLEEFGPKVILRLGRDPIQIAVGTDRRGVLIDRVCRNGGSRHGELREISWAGLPQLYGQGRELPGLLNQNDITT